MIFFSTRLWFQKRIPCNEHCPTQKNGFTSIQIRLQQIPIAYFTLTVGGRNGFDNLVIRLNVTMMYHIMWEIVNQVWDGSFEILMELFFIVEWEDFKDDTQSKSLKSRHFYGQYRRHGLWVIGGLNSKVTISLSRVSSINRI